jgi:hypothetical protein
MVKPLAAFFVPFCVDLDHWETTSAYAGIVFDRCRLSWLVPTIPSTLAEAYPEVSRLSGLQ